MTSQISNTSTTIMNSTITPLYPILCVRNAHPRDKNIHFEEEGHKYTISNASTGNASSSTGYTSVTTWVHSHFPHFDADLIITRMMSGKAWKPGHKYWGLSSGDQGFVEFKT